MTEDIRWLQCFSNYRKALKKLNEGVEVVQNPPGTIIAEEKEAVKSILKDGLIHRFEYTHESACNVIKDYCQYQGFADIKGSRDATRKANEMGLIEDAEVWMEMLQSRNETSHTYNEETADDIHERIVHHYQFLFKVFEEKMESLRSGAQGDILAIKS